MLLLRILVGSLIFLFVPACFKSDSVSKGIIIILNGTSAVGKSSIIKSFQDKMPKPWLNMGIDNFFVGVIPPKFYLQDTPFNREVMRGVASEDESGKLFTLTIGQEGQKIIHGMHRAIAAYAKAGNNIIVDYITYDQNWLKDLDTVFAGLKVIKVGIKASLQTVLAREKLRATSPQGHARSIYNTVHQGWKYDLEIDTDKIVASQAADILACYIKK